MLKDKVISIEKYKEPTFEAVQFVPLEHFSDDLPESLETSPVEPTPEIQDKDIVEPSAVDQSIVDQNPVKTAKKVKKKTKVDTNIYDNIIAGPPGLEAIQDSQQENVNRDISDLATFTPNTITTEVVAVAPRALAPMKRGLQIKRKGH